MSGYCGLLAGFLAGVVTATGGAALAVNQDKPPAAHCHVWKDPRAAQCNAYFGDVKHMRVNLYEEGEWTASFDWWPDALAQRPVRRDK